MSENKNHISKQKLIDYLKGKLSDQESNKIERLLLENKFYQEAMEGLDMIKTDDLEIDLKELERKLSIQTGRKAIIPWFRIAAVISFLGLATVILYFTINQFNRNTKEEVVSLNLPTEETIVNDKEETALNQLKDEQDANMAKPKSAAKTEPVPETTLHEEPSPAQGDPDEVAGKKGLESQMGRVITQPAIPAESDYLAEEMEEAPLEFEEVDKMAGAGNSPSPDLKTAVDNENVNQEKKLKRSKSMAVPVLSHEINEYSEGNPQPTIGYDAFFKYIESNLNYPFSAKTNNVQGIVEVSFMVPADSIPKDFEIIQSLGNGCDEEAIRLIKEGPKWIPLIRKGEISKEAVSLEIIFRIR